MQKKIKVIEFIPSLGDGGAETLVKEYCRLLDQEIFDVEIIALNPVNTANSMQIQKMGIKISYLDKIINRFIRALIKPFKNIYISIKLRQVIKKVNPDVIHVHLEILKYISFNSKLLKDRNIRLFYTCHNLPELFFCGKRKKEGRSARKLIQINSLQLIALHDDMAKEINEMFNVKNTVIIRNGIDYNRFENVEESKNEIRAGLGFSSKDFIVGHVGRFSKQKNHVFIIDVFSKLVEKKDNAKLLLIGVGVEEENIRNRITQLGLSDRVVILHNRSDIPQLMKAMDVFLFPSLYEGFGNVLIEAQVSKLKCVISDKINTAAIISNLVSVLSLDDPIEKWVDCLISDKINMEKYENYELYDMNKEIKRLQKLYMGETIS